MTTSIANANPKSAIAAQRRPRNVDADRRANRISIATAARPPSQSSTTIVANPATHWTAYWPDFCRSSRRVRGSISTTSAAVARSAGSSVIVLAGSAISRTAACDSRRVEKIV
jgi:hypothetical protein